MKATRENLKKALLSLRWGVFIVLFMWTLDKFVNPEHASKVFAKFYFFDGLSNSLAYLIGSVQMLVIIGFVLGLKKKLTYGLVFIMHAISTLSSYSIYLDPWGPRNLLFFAAWPMLAAAYALFLLRDEDTLLTIEKA